ncbi:hypothetical protein DN068_19315 [Taibaiella soli]|uniref:Uncharacterized protein n=2 Tax=Taibaiella soli TaxID=1649169 RepID=A0A2W2B5G5_9BACT|nr:hypothetical protein DN068_19315 [Taibaiella soli]
MLPIIFSIIYQLVKRQFKKSLLSFGALIVGMVMIAVISIMAFLKEQFSPDHYADKLIIPHNITINIPSDTTFSPSDILSDFQLYKGGQRGFYNYAIWIKNIEKGYCYLKAFEITHNDPLSAKELKADSRIDVFNPSDTTIHLGMGLNKYGGPKNFIIYEGDWGKFYAARFELWFVPANGAPERKIAEKNFKIEGWMR